jgi:hypothetical protein
MNSGFLTVTELNDFNGPAQTTNLGVDIRVLSGARDGLPCRKAGSIHDTKGSLEG